MDAGADHGAAAVDGTQRGGHELARPGAKRIAASSGSGRRASEGPAHAAPSETRELAGRRVARSREREHAPALVARDLQRRCARRRRSRRAPAAAPSPAMRQRAVADESRAEQRRRFRIAVALGQREAEALVGDHGFGEAAVEVVAGEARLRAQVLPAGQAEPARAASPAEPRHADALPGREPLRSRARRVHDTHDLVAGHDRPAEVGQLAVDDVQVGAAHAARADAQPHLAGPGLGPRPFDETQRLARSVEDERSHRAAPPAVTGASGRPRPCAGP